MPRAFALRLARRDRSPAEVPAFDAWPELVAAGRERNTDLPAPAPDPTASDVPPASLAPSSPRSGFPPSDRGEGPTRSGESWEAPRLVGTPSGVSASRRDTAALSPEAIA